MYHAANQEGVDLDVDPEVVALRDMVLNTNAIIRWATAEWESDIPDLVNDGRLLAAIRRLEPGESLGQAHPDIFPPPPPPPPLPPPPKSHSCSPTSDSAVEIPPPHDPSLYKRRRLASPATSRHEGTAGREQRPAKSVVTDARNQLPQSVPEATIPSGSFMEAAPSMKSAYAAGGDCEESEIDFPIDFPTVPKCEDLLQDWSDLCTVLEDPDSAHGRRALRTALAVRDDAAERYEHAKTESKLAYVELRRANAELARAQKFVDDTDKEIHSQRLKYIARLEELIRPNLPVVKKHKVKKTKGDQKGKGKQREVEWSGGVGGSGVQ